MKYIITIKVYDHDLALIDKSKENIIKMVKDAIDEYLPFETYDLEHDIEIKEG